MNKRTKKHVLVMLTLLVVMVMLSTVGVFANNPSDITKWVGTEGTELNDMNKQVEKGGASIFKLISTFGNIAGLIVLSMYGIKWFLSSNDSSARKELKDKAVNYVVGALIFFGAMPLYKIIYSFAQSFTKG